MFAVNGPHAGSSSAQDGRRQRWNEREQNCER